MGLNDEHEWTTVKRKLRSKGKSKSKRAGSKNDKHTHYSDDNVDSTQPINEQEIIRIKHRILRCLKKLDAVDFVKQVRESLVTHTLGQRKITKAVIIGLGNLDNSSLRDAWRATWQISIFISVLKSIGSEAAAATTTTTTTTTEEKSSDACLPTFTIPIWAQDPAFTKTDCAFLSGIGVSVVPIPQGVDQIDENTLLFVPFIDAVVLLPEILCDKRMLVYIGSDIETVVEKVGEEGYAERLQVDEYLIPKTIRVGRLFLQNMKKLNIDYEQFNEVALFGLETFVATESSYD